MEEPVVSTVDLLTTRIKMAGKKRVFSCQYDPPGRSGSGLNDE